MSGSGHFIPSVTPHLIASWRLNAELPARAPPLTASLVYVLAQLAVFQSGWAATVAPGLSHFVRSGDLFSAKAGDFVLAFPLSKSSGNA